MQGELRRGAGFLIAGILSGLVSIPLGGGSVSVIVVILVGIGIVRTISGVRRRSRACRMPVGERIEAE